jgi:flagellin
MAINDISLTAGMRANLLSLQGTVNLLERTQSRLSSGNKVNSALDNPTSYFASQVLNSRASKIDGLKDAMGQAIQTVQAADKGIKGITSLIEQAKGVAQSAQSVEASSGYSTVDITLANAALTDAVIIGGTTLTAGPTPGAEVYTLFTMTLGNVIAGNTVDVGGITFTASAGAPANTKQFNASGVASADATALKGALDTYFGDAYTVTITGAGSNVVTVAAKESGLTVDTVTNSVGGTITITDTHAPAPGVLTDTQFAIGGNDDITAMNLAYVFNNSTNAALHTLQDDGYTATANGNVVTIGRTGYDVVKNVVGGANQVAQHDVTMVATDVAASTELSSLEDQYNTMLTQITEMAEDSGYKGKNLLSATQTSRELTVTFEGAELEVVGADATAITGLGLDTAAWSTLSVTDVPAAISADIELLDAALTTLRQNASSLSGNLSIIKVRQDFSTDMVNTLTEGSNKLTLADTNEEGANMLMLQTRQSLSTTALSLSAQAAQSVLRLFQ